jgi:hypothetical protein
VATVDVKSEQRLTRSPPPFTTILA